jgi:hypothetical protein
MGGRTDAWFMVCVGDEVKDRFVVAHNKQMGDENYEVQ